MSKIDDMIGNRYYRLFIHEREKVGTYKVLAECDCGKIWYTDAEGILAERTKSCGCLSSEITAKRNKETAKHGLSVTDKKLYDVYKQMIYRCHNPKNKDYKHYGLRGIKVHDEWRSDAVEFVRWSKSNGYIEGLSIDRVDTNGNYEPSNCRWITIRENIGKRNTEYAMKNKK